MRWLALLALVPMVAFAFQKPAEQPPAPTFGTHVLPFMKKYCLDCHTGEYAEDKVDLSKIKTAKDAQKALAMMKKAAREATSKSMPPKDYSKQPTQSERKSFAAWINAQK